MSFQEIADLEKQIFELTQQVNELRASNKGIEIPNYTFAELNGPVTLKQFFGEHKQLMVIHNMGQGCRYCTLWGDGLNPFLPHLEEVMAVVMVSKNDPISQRRFANSRQWRFRMASHGGEAYIKEQSIDGKSENLPGVALYELDGDTIRLKNRSAFGPYDQFCSIWNFLSLAGLNVESWTPQFSYWRRPKQMDDGGSNLN